MQLRNQAQMYMHTYLSVLFLSHSARDVIDEAGSTVARLSHSKWAITRGCVSSCLAVYGNTWGQAIIV
jgi:hypothetical protein